METLDTYEFTRGRSGTNYDYEAMFDGGIHRLKRGEDFHGKKIQSLRNYLSAQAREQSQGRKKLKTNVEDDDNLVIRLVDNPNGDKPVRSKTRARKPSARKVSAATPEPATA